MPDAEERSLHIVGYIRTAESHCGEALPTVDPQFDLLNVNNQPKNVCNLAQSDDIVSVVGTVSAFIPLTRFTAVVIAVIVGVGSILGMLSGEIGSLVVAAIPFVDVRWNIAIATNRSNVGRQLSRTEVLVSART